MSEKKSFLEEFLENSEGLEQPTPAETQQDENEDASPSEPQPVETVEIDGVTVDFYQAEDGAIEYNPPEGFDEMDDAQKATFERKAGEASKTLGKLKEERMHQNEKDRKIAELEAKLAEATASTSETAASDEIDGDPRKYWGVDTWADVSDLQTDDQARYAKGLSAKASAEALAHTAKVTQQQSIRNKIEADGLSYDVIQRFAKDKGIGSLEVAYDYYKLQNTKGPDGSLLRMRRKSPSTIPPNSGITPEAKPSEVDTINSLIGGYELK